MGYGLFEPQSSGGSTGSGPHELAGSTHSDVSQDTPLADRNGLMFDAASGIWLPRALVMADVSDLPDTYPPSPHEHDATYVNEVDHTKAQHDALGIDAATLDGQDSTTFQTRSEKGAASGYAPLDAGSLIPSFHLPPLAISETYVVNSEAAQLGLNAQEGDVAVRSDQSRSYIHNGGVAGTMADWTELSTPPDAVKSVDGRTGTISLSDLYTPASHGPRTDNPHGVTATQAGAAPSAHVGSGGTAHADATASESGFLAEADKSKLDGVRPNNAYAELSRINFVVPTNSYTPVPMNSEDADPRNWHSLTTNLEQIVVDSAGFFALSAKMVWDTNSTGQRNIRITRSLQGNIGPVPVNPSVGAAAPYTLTGLGFLSAGEYITLEVFQNTGANLNLSIAGLSIARLM